MLSFNYNKIKNKANNCNKITTMMTSSHKTTTITSCNRSSW